MKNQRKRAVKQAICRGRSEDTQFLRGSGGANIKLIEREALHRLPGVAYADDQRKLLQQLIGLLDAKRFSEVVPLGEQAVSVMRDGVDEVDSARRGPSMFVLNPCVLDFYQILVRAYIGLGEYDKAIKHATTGIDLVQSMVADVQAKSSPDFSRMLDVRISLLETRGAASGLSSNFEGAVVDFRACVALARELGREHDDYMDKVQNLMIAMAQLNAGKPRPHYTDAEIRAWNKELCIKEYSPSNLVCAGCMARPSVAVSLKVCGRCQRAWYCGVGCQRASWTQHKAWCQPPTVRKLTVLPDEEKAQVLEDIGELGYFVAVHHTGPGVVLRDAATGELYESLSDQDVVFASDPRLLSWQPGARLSASESAA